MSHLFFCKKSNKSILKACVKEDCEWFIHCTQFCNCTFVAASFGPFSNTEIGIMMHYSGEWVRQIEQTTLKRLKEMKIQGTLPGLELNDEEDQIFPDFSN
jgi:hypothetical protein